MEILKRVTRERDGKLVEMKKQVLEGHHRLVEEIRKLKDDMEKSKALEGKVWGKALKEVEAKATAAEAKATAAAAMATAAAAEAAEAKAETKKLSSDLEQEKLRAERAEEKLKAVDESQQAELEDHRHFIIHGRF